MPDITMCHGGRCPLKEDCYRFTANPSEYMQSYFVTVPWFNGNCTEFAPEYRKKGRPNEAEPD